MPETPTAYVDYTVIRFDDYVMVLVPECTDETRYRAATLLADFDAPHAVAWLAGRARKITLSPHMNAAVDDIGCGCEETEGWWCPNADGEPREFWEFTQSDVEAFERRVEEEDTP